MTWPARMTHTFEIIPRAPYSFDLTAARFGRFAGEIVELLDGKHYRRLLSPDNLSLAYGDCGSRVCTAGRRRTATGAPVSYG